MGLKKLTEGADRNDHRILAKSRNGAHFSLVDAIKCPCYAGDFTYRYEGI